MKFGVALLLLRVIQADAGGDATGLDALRERAAAIQQQERAEEITTEQARRRVQLLVDDVEAWAEAQDVELQLRSRTYTASAGDGAEPLSVDRCSLFFEDSTDELCLIDLKRTEIWSTSVLFCRYVCE